jgi:2'-5' RNA ligase
MTFESDDWMARTFSVWLCPAAENEASLQDAIRTATATHGDGVAFAPHVTVLGSIPESLGCDASHLAEAIDRIARITPACSIHIDRVVCGCLFFQCVYGLCEKSAKLTAIFESACAAKPMAAHPESYMPHVSFLYGDVGADQREAARSALAAHFDGFSFQATRLELWDTTGAVSSWRCLHQCDLL